MALKESNKNRSKVKQTQKENTVKLETVIAEDTKFEKQDSNRNLLIGIAIGVIIFLILF